MATRERIFTGYCSTLGEDPGQRYGVWHDHHRVSLHLLSPNMEERRQVCAGSRGEAVVAQLVRGVGDGDRRQQSTDLQHHHRAIWGGREGLVLHLG